MLGTQHHHAFKHCYTRETRVTVFHLPCSLLTCMHCWMKSEMQPMVFSPPCVEGWDGLSTGLQGTRVCMYKETIYMTEEDQSARHHDELAAKNIEISTCTLM